MSLNVAHPRPIENKGADMISFIEGVIEDGGENYIVINAGGLGYEIAVSSFAAAQWAAEIGKKNTVRVLTHLIVRDDAVTLYGFGEKTEKAMFLRLISISGVGPKLAMAVLGGISLNALAAAIAGGNAGALSKIKGVGKKTAERIVLELRDRIKAEFKGDGDELTAQQTTFSSAKDDAFLALLGMGFSRAEATEALSRVDVDGLSIEEIIIKALRR